jgi:hypothetical protein
MTLDVLPAEIRAIIHDLATSAERIEGRPAGRELVVDLNAAAQAVVDAVNALATVEIPCRMHRGTSHPLTLREAAVVIVTLFGMAEDDARHPGRYNADQGQCVREILSMGKDQEGYAEHVESLLGPDAFDYPDMETTE